MVMARAYGRGIVDEQPATHLPRPRTRPAAPVRTVEPLGEASRPAQVPLFDVSGLLVVLGLVVAGFLLALVLTHHVP